MTKLFEALVPVPAFAIFVWSAGSNSRSADARRRLAGAGALVATARA